MAEGELFSNAQTDVDPSTVSEAIREALTEVQAYPRVQGVRLVRWNDNYVGITANLEVDRPSRGTPSGADIRHREQITFVLHRTSFPHLAPSIRADRRDFPYDLPHLNPVTADQPRSLCLHRGSLNDWFAEHSMQALVDRVRKWLHDAAHGTLIRETDRFEVTRLENPFGSAVYPYQEFVDFVGQDHGTDRAPVLVELLGSKGLIGSGGYSLYYQSFPVAELLEKLRDLSLRYNEVRETFDQAEKLFFGLLVWPDLGRITRRYFGSLPATYAELVEFANAVGIDLESKVREFIAMGLVILQGLPIFLVVPRPQPLIGKDTHLEILSFIVLHETGGETIAPEAKVLALNQVEPMTPASARRLSRRDEQAQEPRVMMLGVGALGSKIALHRGRGGDDALTLVDMDSLAPHNLVRHALLREGLGKNKGKALREAIGNIYQGGPGRTEVRVLERSAFEVLADGPGGDLAGHGLLLDCTAEQSVLHALTEAALPEGCRVVRVEIGDVGRLGFWLAEGPNRSPRLDDLQTLLFAQGLGDEAVSRWLQTHRDEREALVGPALEEIALGVSCSTTTLRLADDVISYHAAAISLALRDLPDAGEVGISGWSGDGGTPGIVRRVTVSPTVARSPGEALGWQVRFLGPAVDFMRARFLKADHHETGGVLFGRIDTKRKTIYVAVASPPPPDSVGRTFVFRRGVTRLPEEVERVHQCTGGLLDYVGEWHTHPRGNGNLSARDQATADELYAIHKPDHFPTLIVIVTPTDFTPHLFLP